MTPLERLHAWAVDQATTDPDTGARPLWAQIRDEVAAYLCGDEPGQKESLFDE